jgi:two-component system, chemotaxis family, chemotaxis protein CheY
MRILIVDDNKEFLGVAERFLLSDPQIEVVGTAHSGPEAIDSVIRLKPDLVLMDIAMPEMNGLEATRKIKEEPDPPLVVILTLYDNPEYRDVAKEIRADGFLSKSEFGTRLIPLIHELWARLSPEPSSKEKSMKHILIVDDSTTMRRMVLASLQGIRDVRFSEAGNGLEAIEKMTLAPVDLLTLDLNMPEMHGLEVLKFLRSHRKFRDIPVVVLTTRGDEESRKACQSAGVSLYITKPFDPHTFARSVEELIGRS